MPQGPFSIYKDEELIIFVTEGKVQAFDELYFRYSGRLMTYFVRMLNYNRTQAEDALQDLFMKIAQNPQSFQQGRSFKTWIYSIAHNTCKNYYRHKQVVEQHEQNMNHVSEHEDHLSKIASKIDHQQFRLKLEEALNSLSPEKKEAFILRYQEEHSIAEIALIQDCPEGSVKSRLHYALKLLEEKLIVFKINN